MLPGAPSENPSGMKLGTRRTTSNTDYYVVKNKAGEKRWAKQKTWFVIYRLDHDASWTYGKFPRGWDWAGGGSTLPLTFSRNLRYPREEQFVGPPDTSKQMKAYLDAFFSRLRLRKIVQEFRIVTRVGLHNYMERARFGRVKRPSHWPNSEAWPPEAPIKIVLERNPPIFVLSNGREVYGE